MDFDIIKQTEINRTKLSQLEQMLIEVQYNTTNKHVAMEIKLAREHIRTATEKQHTKIMLELAKRVDLA